MKTQIKAGLTHGEWIRVKNGELKIRDVMDRLIHGETVFEGNQTHGLMAMLNYLCGDAGLEFGFSRKDVHALRHVLRVGQFLDGGLGGRGYASPELVDSVHSVSDLAARIDSFLPPEPS